MPIRPSRPTAIGGSKSFIRRTTYVTSRECPAHAPDEGETESGNGKRYLAAALRRRPC
jgi:hypothetical protein